jgi:hypothetical protein
MGFNQWAMRVTEADFDADMIRRLAESPGLNRAFAELLAGDREMQTYVKVFAAFWNFRVRDMSRRCAKRMCSTRRAATSIQTNRRGIKLSGHLPSPVQLDSRREG